MGVTGEEQHLLSNLWQEFLEILLGKLLLQHDLAGDSAIAVLEATGAHHQEIADLECSSDHWSFTPAVVDSVSVSIIWMYVCER